MTQPTTRPLPSDSDNPPEEPLSPLYGRPVSSVSTWGPAQPGGALYAFAFPNFRLFFVGQLISVAGTWMQTVAQQWLVFDLTHSSTWLGIVSGATAVPYVLFAFWGGEIADRLPRRTILLWTQSAAMLFAFVLAFLATNRFTPVQPWHIAALAGLGGVVNAFNMPAQQAFVTEMVDDPRALSNAIALNSLRFNLARFLGPMLAGIALVKLSAAACFFLNGLSFIAVIISLARMRIRVRERPVYTENRKDTWEGLRFILGVPSLLRVTVLVGLGSLLVLSVSTLFPVLAEQYHQGASGFSTIVTINGIGATLGGAIVVTFGSRIARRFLVYGGALAFSLALLALSVSPTFTLVLVTVFAAGIGMVIFTTSSNTKVQEDAPNELRGRIMAVYSLVANSLMPVGGLLLGFLAEKSGVLPTIRIAALISFIASAILYLWSYLESRQASRTSRVG
jgi:MFS family permease